MTNKPQTAGKPRFSLWIGVFFGFATLTAAWTALFVAASHHRVAEVPIAKSTPSP